MAYNERGRWIADPYINMRNDMIAQQEMLAQRNAGLRGINYNPEDADYDEAYGPADRTRRTVPSDGVHGGVPSESEYNNQQTIAQERRVRGQN